MQLQLDLYHHQITRGDVSKYLMAHVPTGTIGHVQVASVPLRNEPDETSELNYPAIYRTLDEIGYQGWLGCEYRPRGETEAGLGWMPKSQ